MTRDEIIERMGWAPSAENGMSDIVDRIDAIVLRAVAEQRERDAQICDSYGMPDGTSETARVLAAAIRGRR